MRKRVGSEKANKMWSSIRLEVVKGHNFNGEEMLHMLSKVSVRYAELRKLSQKR